MKIHPSIKICKTKYNFFRTKSWAFKKYYFLDQIRPFPHVLLWPFVNNPCSEIVHYPWLIMRRNITCCLIFYWITETILNIKWNIKLVLVFSPLNSHPVMRSVRWFHLQLPHQRTMSGPLTALTLGSCATNTMKSFSKISVVSCS